jgi:hypothetical protein
MYSSLVGAYAGIPAWNYLPMLAKRVFFVTCRLYFVTSRPQMCCWMRNSTLNSQTLGLLDKAPRKAIVMFPLR